MARSHFSYEKRRKELDKKKKKEAKRQERLERKALKAEDPDADVGGPPIVPLDADGNPMSIETEDDDEELEDDSTEP